MSVRVDRKFCPEDHRLALRGLPSDDNGDHEEWVLDKNNSNPDLLCDKNCLWKPFVVLCTKDISFNRK